MLRMVMIQLPQDARSLAYTVRNCHLHLQRGKLKFREVEQLIP